MPGRPGPVPHGWGGGAASPAGGRRSGAAVQRTVVPGLSYQGRTRHGAGFRSFGAHGRGGAVAAPGRAEWPRSRAPQACRGRARGLARTRLWRATAELRGGGPARRRPHGDRIRAHRGRAQRGGDRNVDEAYLPHREPRLRADARRHADLAAPGAAHDRAGVAGIHPRGRHPGQRGRRQARRQRRQGQLGQGCAHGRTRAGPL
ncbi:hypothetical protein G6F65_020585 [Rhizopus arrhizus]|nr:hypothetical protein G6F65_020585 [Rhizopus arrhizus]